MPCPFSLSLLRFPRLRVERCLFSARRLRLGEEPLRSPHMATRWASTTPVFALSRLFRNICALPQCPGGERCGILACPPADLPADLPTCLPVANSDRIYRRYRVPPATWEEIVSVLSTATVKLVRFGLRRRPIVAFSISTQSRYRCLEQPRNVCIVTRHGPLRNVLIPSKG